MSSSNNFKFGLRIELQLVSDKILIFSNLFFSPRAHLGCNIQLVSFFTTFFNSRNISVCGSKDIILPLYPLSLIFVPNSPTWAPTSKTKSMLCSVKLK